VGYRYLYFHVARYDWKDFLNRRLKGHGNLSKAFDAEGWKLVYNDAPNNGIGPLQTHFEAGDLTYSIGVDVSPTGTLLDVLWGGPAFHAGMAPGMTIAGVNGKIFTIDGLKGAITEGKTGKVPIRLLVRTFERYETIGIDYHGGLQYPHLERIDGTADYLSQVLAPLDHVLARVR
jgi:predicted metalloprotease with PDZ domain